MSFCSQCGHRLAGTTGALPAFAPAPRGDSERTPATAAFSRTMIATPGPVRLTGRATVAIKGGGALPASPEPPRSKSKIRWATDAVGYIYVYLRSKLDAGERRRRLIDERAGAEALLSGALNELATVVLREGVQHADLTGLLEAIGRAHARRETAAADADAADLLQQTEATRLGAQQEAAEADWLASDRASRDAEEILRAASEDRGAAGARLARVEDELTRLGRERTADDRGGEARAAQVAHESVGLAAEHLALAQQIERLDRQLADLRDNAVALRTAAAGAKAKLEAAVASRRGAAAAMAASIAGRQRDRALAEREIVELTGQLGRATAEIRPPHQALLSAYQSIDRLQATIANRGAELETIEQMRSHYDHRKLMTGLGLVTSMLIATAAALWAVLK